MNVHAAMTPDDIWNQLEPVFTQARNLKEAFKKGEASKKEEASKKKASKKEETFKKEEASEKGAVADQPTLREPFVTVSNQH